MIRTFSFAHSSPTIPRIRTAAFDSLRALDVNTRRWTLH